MKNDEFDRRVRAFFADAPRPAAPDALRRLPGTLTVPDGERPHTQHVHRGPALAGLSMAGLVVVVLAAALLVRFPGGHAGTSEGPVGASGASPTGTSSPASSPTPSTARAAYALDGLAWQEIGAGTFDGVESLAFFPVDQGSLVVGTSRTAQVRLWFSGDGSSFRPLDASAFASDLDPASYPVAIHGVVKGPAGYLAVGAQVIPAKTVSLGPVTSPLVWRSADGLHWSRVDTRGLPGVGLASIAATSRGYVVAPEATYTGSSITPHEAYVSADGTSWQATAVIVNGLVGQDGHVVAVTSQSAIAVSDDGKAWTTLHPAKQLVTVEASPDGFVAIAYDQTTTKMSVLRSSDGRNWTNAGEPSANWANGMTYAMGRWVMFVSSSAGYDRTTVAVSPDAVGWQSKSIPYQVVGSSMLGLAIYPFGDGFFAESTVALGPGTFDTSGPLQVHLWWVRAAQAGDSPGSTAPPEPTTQPVATPTGGITEAQAIDIATARYQPMKGTTPYRKLVPIGGFDPKQTAVSPDRLVWAVMILVPKPECSPPPDPKPSACDLPYTSEAVLVDYVSGDIVEVLDQNV